MNSEKIRTLIIEDEELARKLLRSYLEEKEEIDTTTTKVLNFIDNFPNKPLPQIYYVHLSTT